MFLNTFLLTSSTVGGKVHFVTYDGWMSSSVINAP